MLEYFRTGFLGKVSPVHLVLGQLRILRSRGFRAPAPPLHPGGVPGLPDAVTRERVFASPKSARRGFWPGGGPVEYPAFYSYACPSPDGFSTQPVIPREAFFDAKAGRVFAAL